MKRLKRLGSIYGTCIKSALSMTAAYRANFLLGMIITLFSNLSFPLITVFIYGSGASFPDWTVWEVLLLQSIFTMSLGVSSMIFNGVVWDTMGHIREGSFEIILLRPISPLFYMIARNFSPESVGLLIGGGVMMGISLVFMDAVVSWLQWGQFLLLFFAGVAVMAGLYFIMAAISFKWVGNSRIPEIFDSVRTFGKYPKEIFPKAIQGVIAFLIPVAMVGFFPCTALMGNLTWYAFLAVIPCILFFLFGIWLYNKMIALYEGVGG